MVELHALLSSSIIYIESMLTPKCFDMFSRPVTRQRSPKRHAGYPVPCNLVLLVLPLDPPVKLPQRSEVAAGRERVRWTALRFELCGCDCSDRM